MFSFIRHRINQYNDARTARTRYRELRKYIIMDGGYFVEAGGYDGRTQSNTYGLERWASWRGILAEPIPELAAMCRKIRPRSVTEAVALVADDYDQATVKMRFAGSMSMVSGFSPREDSSVSLGAERHNVASYELEVPAITLTALLDKHGVEQVDFVSFDAEGYELQMLHGLDLSRFSPQWLLIEGGETPEICEYLDGRYVKLANIEMDTLWRRSSPDAPR